MKSEAQPTLTHMALVRLLESNYLKYLVSQNCDGLHVKSGIPAAKISELHGNTNVEACAKCAKLYYRNFRVRKVQNRANLTGRRCECGTPLRYTTVAFGQSMPDECFTRAEQNSEIADVTLCLGTSMRVTPACDLPVAGKKTNKNHALCIVNLQKTPFDDQCAVRIYHKVDVVITMLMKMLDLEIPAYVAKDLSTDQQWLQLFAKHYKFRSPGEDWFEGNLQREDSVLQQCQ